MQITNVIKRNGEVVAFDPSHLTKWAEWASNEGVDWFSVVSEAYKRCPNKCTTKDLHYAMIAACLDKETTPYLRMAGRLLVGDVYKQAFGGHDNIPSLNEFYHKMVGLGYYENMGYSEDEITYLDCHIKHDLDKQMIYSEIKQYLDKYCISDKVNSRAIESPQFAIMRVAMGVMQYEKEKRLENVIALYNMLSQKKINAPTPYMVNLGTPKRGLASCCVYTTADNIPSITVGDHIAYMMTCNSAGIGAHMQTRSKGDGVRNNTIKHLGKLPYYKMVESSVSANLQNGRGGAATMYFTVLDPEIMDLIALKTPTTVADKQIRKIDYAVSYNKRFLDAVRNNEEWMLISYKNAPDLYDAMYMKEQETFNSLYEQYKENILVRKTFVKARDLMFAIVHHRVSTGRLYLFRPDIANKHTPFKEKIYSSNLCVSGDTLLLTSKGNIRIADHVGEEVEVWNGEQWSKTTVVKTGENQELVTVATDSGEHLTCTPYHKFYIAVGYTGRVVEKRAYELKEGDTLVKFTTTHVEGNLDLEHAYTNGFYSGDGCELDNGVAKLYLYANKRDLKHRLTGVDEWKIEEKRDYCYSRNLEKKFFVPDGSYTIKSRLDWLAGFSDADGTIYRVDGNNQLVMSSVNRKFLSDIQMMLLTLGVRSKIRKSADEGFRKMPLNDGSGGLGDFWCQEAYRLIVTSNNLNKLLSLGFKTSRLIIGEHKPQRDATRFVKIVSVVNAGQGDTYCVNEPLKHKAVFNGILTGQCNEISLPTAPFTGVQDLYSEESEGEIALCSLAAIVVSNVKDYEYEQVAYYALKMVDNVIEMMDYPFKSLARTAKARRSAGVGITGLAHYLAKNGEWYSSKSGKTMMHRLAERHMYSLILASATLAKERGKCEWYDKTLWNDGWMPIDTASESVDDVCDSSLMLNWDWLRGYVKQHGMRNSVVVAHMPCESSSLASNSTNGLYPIRESVVIKTNASSKNVFIAPESDMLYYESAWDASTKDMLEMYGIFQKFTDQAISADTYLVIGNDRKVSGKEMIDNILYADKMGLKGEYYLNSQTTVKDVCEGCSI